MTMTMTTMKFGRNFVYRKIRAESPSPPPPPRRRRQQQRSGRITNMSVLGLMVGVLTLVRSSNCQEIDRARQEIGVDIASSTRSWTPEVSNWNDTSSLQSRLQQQDCASMFKCPPPLDTKSKVLPAWDKLDCRCDDDCETYGDCCTNWRGYDARSTLEARLRFKCVNFVAYRGIYLLSSCPKNWTDETVRDQCESAKSVAGGVENSSDPLSSTPITSLLTRHTYTNYYCAVCNSDVGRVVYWTPRVECDTLQSYNRTYGNITGDYVWRHMRYDVAEHVWGVNLPDGGGGVDFGPFVRDPSFVPCRVVVQMPINVVDMVRQCYPWVDDCPSGWTGNDTVRDLCRSYTAVVFSNVDDMSVYRNVHCALCHNASIADLDCRTFPMYRNVVPSSFAPSFAFLFDINESGGGAVGTLDRCPTGEIYDPFFRYCRQMVCATPDFTLRQGRCVANQVTSTSSSTTTRVTIVSTDAPWNASTDIPVSVTTEFSNTTVRRPTAKPKDEGDEDDCPRFNISSSDYRRYGNGSVYISRYNRNYAPGEYVQSSTDGYILICLPLDGDQASDTEYLYKRKFSVAMAYLTVAGLGISLVCLFFHMAAFVLVPCLRNLSGKNLASLCVVLSVAYVTFIVSQFDGAVSRRACASVGVVLYYSFLATFFWMNSIAFDVWRTLRLATSELRVSAGQQWRKFIIYSAYSWLAPAVIVAASIVVENSSAVSAAYKPAFGQVTCWFGSRRALLVFFVAPIVTVLALNVIMFVLSARIIIGSTQSSSKLHPGSQQQARRNFSLYLRLALIMGLTWVFGVTAGQLDTIEPLWYAFIVLNTLQGLFIFLSFTCTKKVRNYLRDKVFCRRTSYYGSSTQITNTRSHVTRKFGLEGRDSGSGESQTSHTSRTSLTKMNSRTFNEPSAY